MEMNQSEQIEQLTRIISSLTQTMIELSKRHTGKILCKRMLQADVGGRNVGRFFL